MKAIRSQFPRASYAFSQPEPACSDHCSSGSGSRLPTSCFAQCPFPKICSQSSLSNEALPADEWTEPLPARDILAVERPALFAQNPNPAAKENIHALIFSLAAEFLPPHNANYQTNPTFPQGDANFRINAAECRTNPILETNTLAANLHLGHRLPTVPLYPRHAVANSNTATGLPACLYDLYTSARSVELSIRLRYCQALRTSNESTRRRR